MDELCLSRRTRPFVAVIEGDAIGRRALCARLKTLDVDVHDYESAESYLAARDGVPGCLISDVELPGMSGLDLLRYLRLAGMPPPIILLGEDSDVRAAVMAMQEGALDFIEKPHADLAVPRRVAQLLNEGGMEQVAELH